MSGFLNSRTVRPFVALVLLVSTFQVFSVTAPSQSDAAAAGWQIQMMATGKKELAASWPTSARLSKFASPGTTSFPSATAASTGAASRTTIGSGEGVYSAFFNQTGITKVAFVDSSTTSLDPAAHTNYLIFDLVESSGSESFYAILKRLDTYMSTCACQNNDTLWGTPSLTNLTAGTNGYSGTLSASGGTAFKTNSSVTPTKFALYGINRDSDNDQQTMVAYAGDLNTGKSDAWRNDNPLETFWSYWGGDFHSNSNTQRIGNTYVQTTPGVPTSATWPGDVYVLAYTAVLDSVPPTITSTETFTVSENQTSVGAITTSESSTISIFGGADSNKFSFSRIGDSASALSFITAPNFEAPTDVGVNNVYDLVLRAIDEASNVGYETITVTVTDANDPPVITSNSGGAAASITIGENTLNVTTVQATDQDSGVTVSFSISGTDSSDFVINSNSGILTFAQAPDFEAPADSNTDNSYVLIVMASDSIATDTQTITITVTNLNESAQVSAPSITYPLNKGVNSTISVTINVSAIVRFYANGKRISICKDRITSGSYPNNVATCIWKPAINGKNFLSATVTPTVNGFSSVTSPTLEVIVQRRTGLR